MSGVMSYNSLVNDIQIHSERTDAKFIDEIPQFINRAENRIAIQARGLGFIKSITDDLQQSLSYIDKPDRWRETISFQIGTGAGFRTRVVLLQRSYEFCREYWPNSANTDVPKYYADWDYQHWLIAPTPNLGYPYEILYHERPVPLSSSVQTNWTTAHAPNLLLYAALIEAQLFLKRDDRLPLFQSEYDKAIDALAVEQARRLGDRSFVAAKATPPAPAAQQPR